MLSRNMKQRVRLTAAERRAKAAITLSLAQLRFTPLQAQVMLSIGNTLFWSEVGKGRIRVYRDGKKQYVTRPELERYERERREAARQAEHIPRAVRGHKGLARSA